MAFTIKSPTVLRTLGAGAGTAFNSGAAPGPSGSESILDQHIHVQRATAALPQSTTRILFRVYGGKVLIWGLRGEVTTVIQGSDPVMKISTKGLSKADVVVGTAVDVATTVDISSLEVGGNLWIKGDGSAMVKANAGATVIGNTGMWIMGQGEIYATTTASKTGNIKWDLWYMPLDAGAFVSPITVATAAI